MFAYFFSVLHNARKIKFCCYGFVGIGFVILSVSEESLVFPPADPSATLRMTAGGGRRLAPAVKVCTNLRPFRRGGNLPPAKNSHKPYSGTMWHRPLRTSLRHFVGTIRALPAKPRTIFVILSPGEESLVFPPADPSATLRMTAGGGRGLAPAVKVCTNLRPFRRGGNLPPAKIRTNPIPGRCGHRPLRTSLRHFVGTICALPAKPRTIFVILSPSEESLVFPPADPSASLRMTAGGGRSSSHRLRGSCRSVGKSSK